MTSTTQSTVSGQTCRLLTALLCLGLVSGCGLKGDLYLEDRPAASEAAPALPDVDDQDSNREAEDDDGPASATQGG